jgi:hypothetical protein
VRLGFTTMSLYKHVKSKNELLLLMPIIGLTHTDMGI